LAEWSSDTTFLSIGLDGNDCDEFTMQQRNRLLSSGRLTEHPYLPPRSVAEIIGSSGAIALPTRRDCFPVCVLEALHLGTPIISSAIDNLREIASSPPALQLCEHNSGRRFAIQISQVLDNPPLADSLRQRGRALSKEQYSYEQCIAGIQAHVDRLMRLIDEQ
jgi:glycosyltransferase involved in cell wall biosynthesis